MVIEAPHVMTDIEHRGPDPAFPDVRETPAVALLAVNGTTPARPDAHAEPLLDVRNIQGNVLVGFNKDFQTLLFLRIDDVPSFKAWLADFAQLVATAEEVLAFNRLFKRTRDRRGYSGTVKASWINVAFSHAALAMLTNEADAFADASFRTGVVAQSAALGDPTSPEAEGHPDRWLVRDGEDGAHVLILVAADTITDLEVEVGRVEQLVFSPRRKGRPVRSGASIVFKQEGRTQLGTLAGHEHFGFLDGISQPGLRGRISPNRHDVLTPRQNPDDPDQGKPGQDLVWPGEFVFGYPGQSADRDVAQPGVDSLTDGAGHPVVPRWAADGSYLVFRRLRQDVHEFHSFLHDQAGALGLTPAGLGARLVGRWASGAPTMRERDTDNPSLGGDDCADNHFEFQEETEPTQSRPGCGQCKDKTYPQSPGDKTGDRCPFAAHIRKTYPRDDVPLSPAQDDLDEARRRLSEPDTQTHRLLRRGIPYGPSSQSTPAVPVADDVDRGLLFMVYMTSIVDQFEFVTKHWVNNPDFKEPNAGVDPILGQSQAADGSRHRTFNVPIGGADHLLTAPDEWVVPTGGGYFFAPSISTLRSVLGSGRRHGHERRCESDQAEG
jgi:Dyp-type peroxidase family